MSRSDKSMIAWHDSQMNISMINWDIVNVKQREMDVIKHEAQLCKIHGKLGLQKLSLDFSFHSNRVWKNFFLYLLLWLEIGNKVGLGMCGGTFILFQGTLEGRAKALGKTQAVFGFLSMILGIFLLFGEKREWKVMTDPEVRISFLEKNNRFFPKPEVVRDPVMEVVVTPYFPKWDAGLTVFVGGGFAIMGIILLLAVRQKSVRSCTIWLMGTCPMLFVVLCGSLYKWFLTPNLEQLTNGPVWGGFAYCVYIVCMYRKECVEIQKRSEVIKEREVD